MHVARRDVSSDVVKLSCDVLVLCSDTEWTSDYGRRPVASECPSSGNKWRDRCVKRQSRVKHGGCDPDKRHVIEQVRVGAFDF